MREIVARLICIVTVMVVLALAHVFAARHNPQPPAAAPQPQEPKRSAPPPSAEVVRGRQVYVEQGCSSCHAIADAGNPRNPLDGVGARRTRAELFDWVTGTGSAADQLAPAVVRKKERYRALSQVDVNALIAYLVTLKPNP